MPKIYVLLRQKISSWAPLEGRFLIPVIKELLRIAWCLILFQVGSSLPRWIFARVITKSVNDIEKTAFRTHHSHFEFLIMHFGPTSATFTF